MAPTIISVSGFASDSGKTTLLCQLLKAFPGWEAIKITRGHYRSCGKDPQACCVSHLLSTEPVIRSGREQTDAHGKDTGRYWEAGASNVHWLIATTEQVEQGINQALERVEAPGVLIEGTSFLKYLEVDFALMAARGAGSKMKPSARRALAKTNALYLFDEGQNQRSTTAEQFTAWSLTSTEGELLAGLPIYTSQNFPQLIAHLRSLHAKRAA